MKPLAQQSLYEILDVPPDASSAAIAEAVDRAQALYAPGSLATYTLMAPEEEQLLSRLIEEARVTLLDPAARARYDERLEAGAPPEPESPEPPPQPAQPAVHDAAIRAAWPELPPVIPALRVPADEELEEEVEAPPPPPPAPPPAPPPPARPAPILLSREAPAAPPPPPAASPPPEATSWSGEVLRKLREARGLTVLQVSERTKVTRHHIENIEADRYEALPAAVYLRGILVSIAKELRLDGQKVARSYLERVASAASASPPPGRTR